MRKIAPTRARTRAHGWLAKAFDPDQPRDPAGTPTGGQWTGRHARPDRAKDIRGTGMADPNAMLPTNDQLFQGAPATRTIEEAARALDAMEQISDGTGHFEGILGYEISAEALGIERYNIVQGIGNSAPVSIDWEHIRLAQRTATVDQVRNYLSNPGDGKDLSYVHDKPGLSDLPQVVLRQVDGRWLATQVSGTHRLMAARLRGVQAPNVRAAISVPLDGWKTKQVPATKRNLALYGIDFVKPLQKPGDARKRYDPAQPRAPKGTPGGGQWIAEGLATYAGEDPYANAIGINAQLREGRVLGEDDAQTLRAVRMAFTRAKPLEHFMTVYRGTGENIHAKGGMVGHPLSTTLDFDVAVEFSEMTGGASPTVYEIAVHPGSRVLDMTPHLPESMKYQREILLEDGGRLEYRSPRRDLQTHVTNGITVHRMKYVPPGV